MSVLVLCNDQTQPIIWKQFSSIWLFTRCARQRLDIYKRYMLVFMAARKRFESIFQAQPLPFKGSHSLLLVNRSSCSDLPGAQKGVHIRNMQPIETTFFLIELWPTKIQFNNRRQNTRKISVLAIVHAHPDILNRFYMNMSIVRKVAERILIKIKLSTPYVPCVFCN